MRPEPPRVLVVYKRTNYERFGGARNQRVAKLIARDDPTVRHLLEAHETHLATLTRTKEALRHLGARGTFLHRYKPRDGERWDLVVTLGGDGTLLTASHRVGPGIPVVAINSSPLTSVGYFCAGAGDEVESVLKQALDGSLRATRLTRMQLAIDGRIFHRRVLNDVLFCHAVPAAATRYVLTFRGKSEEQLSSGIWVGPAAGSTAAQHSAGGRILPIASKKLQFVVREPYAGIGPHAKMVKGLVGEQETLSIRSKIREGMLFVDGHDLARKVDIGTEIVLSRSDEPLTLLGLRR